MNKTAIKNFAIWAREKLIKDITYKASTLGITDEFIAEKLPTSTDDFYMYDIGAREPIRIEKQYISQREKFAQAIRNKEKDTKNYKEAFEYVVEEVAYTWFNRLVAIRFMEVNEYLPSGVRALSSQQGDKLEPDMVTNPFDADLELLNSEKEKILELKEENKLDELFRMLFIKQCNQLQNVLPELFEATDDYTELLLTISFTDKDGIIYHLTHDIDEKDFNVEEEGQVEIIGWLYQFYNSVPKEIVFANLKKNIKINKDNIPAATQLFTPDWIVRYMVENSLGRRYIEQKLRELGLNSEAERIAKEQEIANEMSWKYYLTEAEQTEEVRKEINSQLDNSGFDLQNLTLIDPCCGSGHILVYAFDVLMQIYESYGYTSRDAVQSIIRNNIYGLDLDKRAAQLAYFAIMMKARAYDRRFLTRNLQPNIYAITESNDIDNETIDYYCNGDEKLIKAINTIKREMFDAKEYGSIISVTPQDFDYLYSRFDEIYDEASFYKPKVLEQLLPLVKVAEIMSKKYDVVSTNPPYMGGSGMDAKLSNYVKENYPDSKTDLFSVFIEKCLCLAKPNAFSAMITQHAFMFLSSFEKLRSKLLNYNIVNMAHLGARAFEEIGGEVVQTTSFVMRKNNTRDYKATYSRLVDYNSQDEKEKAFLERNNLYIADKENFSKIPGSPIAYWASESVFKCFENKNLAQFVSAVKGLDTCDNDNFVRVWSEVDSNKIGFNIIDTSQTNYYKWYPYCKGGGYQKWYGFLDKIVNWEKDGLILRNLRDEKGKIKSRPQNIKYYFKEGLTFSTITSYKLSLRYMNNSIFGGGGSGIFYKDNPFYILAYINSNTTEYFLDLLNPTLNFLVGDILSLPIIFDEKNKEYIEKLSQNNISLSKSDWDSFETSWDFVKSPLINNSTNISDAYNVFKNECEERFTKLKVNEEELNRIFIDIYGLNDELTPEVDDKDVTVYRIFDTKDDIPETMGKSRYALTKQDVIKDFVSYAVGCMFGRYSLDIDGLAFAGGDWDSSKYKTFIPDADNCIPITDTQYLEDDIVTRFVNFVECIYGKASLEENLKFIANALGNKGTTSRDVIRNYFLGDFIKDHIKKYQKRPIYWMFDSGKQNGFKALVYMHRWNADTVGNLRVEYLHKIQRVYEKEIERMQYTIDTNADNKEIARATKTKEKLQKQLKETKDYDGKIAHIALSRIEIDLDDGVKVNYEKVQTAPDGKKAQILSKI